MIDKFEIVECRNILVTVLENFWNDKSYSIHFGISKTKVCMHAGSKGLNPFEIFSEKGNINHILCSRELRYCFSKVFHVQHCNILQQINSHLAAVIQSRNTGRKN
jgi:hypothetical protein